MFSNSQMISVNPPRRSESIQASNARPIRFFGRFARHVPNQSCEIGAFLENFLAD